jgi:hypothetical protein
MSAGVSEEYETEPYGSRGRAHVTQVIAGYLAAAAIFAGVLSLFWYPGRIGLAAMFLAVLSAALGGTIQRFTGLAMAVSTLGFFFGMIIAVVLDRPIF